VTSDLALLTGMDAPTGLLIGGQWSAGAAGVLTVLDPATEQPIAEVASASTADALDAVTAAHDALAPWAARPPRERGECLRRTYELMMRDAEALARLMVVENGKALRDARGEIAYAAEFFRW
jgi:succinate-semialdehyde dehydrogenase/glutarate-semialdehyde dehydrogenase